MKWALNIIAFCLFLFAAVLIYWFVQPVQLPTIDEPIPILNENNEILVGEPIVMQLKINKPQELKVSNSTPRIECVSGNLITLTGTGTTLPTGQQERTISSYLLPPKVLNDDRCIFIFQITYDINPIREVIVEWESEEFKAKTGE